MASGGDDDQRGRGRWMNPMTSKHLTEVVGGQQLAAVVQQGDGMSKIGEGEIS